MKIKLLIYSPWTTPEKVKKKPKCIEIQLRLINYKRNRNRCICPSIKWNKNTITFEFQTYITDSKIRERLSLKTFARLKLGLGSSLKA